VIRRRNSIRNDRNRRAKAEGPVVVGFAACERAQTGGSLQIGPLNQCRIDGLFPSFVTQCPRVQHAMGRDDVGLFHGLRQMGAGDVLDNLNPNSIEIISDAKVEPSLANAAPGTRYQFERLGYFCADPDSKPGKPVFNRTVALKDAWARVEKKQGGKG